MAQIEHKLTAAVLLGVLLGALLGSAPLWARQDIDPEHDWVLQLGYFANLDNAVALQEVLAELGFDASLVATGQPGDQRYRVISGRADAPASLDELRDRIEQHTGQQGFATRDPLAGGTARAVAGETRHARPTQADPQANPQSNYFAQTAPGTADDSGPMRTSNYGAGSRRSVQGDIPSMPGFSLAGLQVVPTIGLGLGYDGNITMADRDEISSWFYLIAPAIRIEMPADHSVLALSAGADIVRYQDSPRDDREPWWVRGDAIWDVSTRQKLALFADYGDGVDRRGESRRRGDAGLIPLDPDEWKRFGYGGAWDYGAAGARGGLRLRAGAYDLDYTNNREGSLPGSLGTRLLDRDWWYAGGTFSWRVAPKTALLLDYLHRDVSYDEAPASDSQIDTWMLGATWDATARTSGTVKFGSEKRDFADPAKEDYDGAAWQASVRWRPRTYSAFTLTATRNTREPDTNADFLLREDIVLSWVHDWASRFGTTMDIGYGEDDFRPNGPTEDLFYWGVGARYAFSQHLRFGVSVTSYHRDSGAAQFDFDRRVFLLTAEWSL